MKCQLVTTPQAAILRQRAERVTLLFKECVYRVAGYEQYCVWGWVSVCSRFFKSSHFSLSLLPIFLLAWPCSAAAVCSGPTGCVDCGSLGPPSIGGQLSTPRFRFRLSVPAASWTGLGGVTVSLNSEQTLHPHLPSLPGALALSRGTGQAAPVDKGPAWPGDPA